MDVYILQGANDYDVYVVLGAYNSFDEGAKHLDLYHANDGHVYNQYRICHYRLGADATSEPIEIVQL